MTRQEKKTVLRIVKYMQYLQRKTCPPHDNPATDEEIRTILGMLWEWTPDAKYPLPAKHLIEYFLALMRGYTNREYVYVSREDVARVIRQASAECPFDSSLQVRLSVKLGGESWREMTDTELYCNGKWNYRETPLVSLLFNYHCNPWMFEGNQD